MQRKLIQVGQAYAVTNDRGKNRNSGSKVRGTVVRLDAEYQHRRYYNTTTRTDGILVRFDEPVLFDHGGPRLLSKLLASDMYTAAAKRNFKSRAVTEWVATDPRFIYDRWDTYEARQNYITELAARHEREADERAAEFATEIEDAAEKLRALGFRNVKIDKAKSAITFDGGALKLSTSLGTEGKRRAVGFAGAVTISTETLLGLVPDTETAVL